MSLISEDVDGCDKFKYDHDRYYREVQRAFMLAVDTLDPNNIVVSCLCPTLEAIKEEET
jgi:hypothetical protein